MQVHILCTLVTVNTVFLLFTSMLFAAFWCIIGFNHLNVSIHTDFLNLIWLSHWYVNQHPSAITTHCVVFTTGQTSVWIQPKLFSTFEENCQTSSGFNLMNVIILCVSLFLYQCRLDKCRFWTVDQTKQVNLTPSAFVVRMCDGHFFFLLFYCYFWHFVKK